MSRQVRLLLLIGLICFGALALIFWPNDTDEPRYPTAGTAVVVFGDSLAAGVGASPGHDIASLLEARLDVPVHNLGVSGNTTAEGRNRLDAVLELDPRVVVILLGGNDAIQRVPVAETFTNLSSIISAIHEHGAAVVLVGEPGGLYGNRYEQEYERLAEQHRTFYVSNILSGLIGRSEFMDDLIHPNDAGYKMAADRILPVVEDALDTPPSE